MNLFIDTISIPATIILFDENRKILDTYSWDIKGNESSTLIPKIDDFLKENNMSYFDLENIVVVNWPWSFTWVRTVVLAANTINYIINKNLTDLSYFDLFENYPIIKSSSKRDSFIKFAENEEVEIIYNDELVDMLKEKNINKLYGETNSNLFEEFEILDKVDYENIIKNINFANNKKIEALYIKKPNIS